MQKKVSGSIFFGNIKVLKIRKKLPGHQVATSFDSQVKRKNGDPVAAAEKPEFYIDTIFVRYYLNDIALYTELTKVSSV